MIHPLPFKLKGLAREFGDRPFRLLDVGAGNRSATQTLHWFPRCEYHGIDRVRDCENTEEDLRSMTQFHEMDLTALDFSGIPEGYFDCLMLSHVMEHLHNGDKVLEGLIPKLKPGGLLYLEYPGPRSTRLPSMKGCLNFYDDETHCRLYSIAEFHALLPKLGCTVIRSGTRRDWLQIALIPWNLLYYRKLLGYIPGGIFWDLLGFAEFVLARRGQVAERAEA